MDKQIRCKFEELKVVIDNIMFNQRDLEIRFNKLSVIVEKLLEE